MPKKTDRFDYVNGFSAVISPICGEHILTWSNIGSHSLDTHREHCVGYILDVVRLKTCGSARPCDVLRVNLSRVSPADAEAFIAELTNPDKHLLVGPHDSSVKVNALRGWLRQAITRAQGDLPLQACA